nr:sulfotransferase family 2 domain-containing protein [uncultured Halomonas sp.]
MSFLFFVHIPKTAGTSFRLGAERYFGKERVCYDYTPHAKDTSECIRKLVYENNDKQGLYREMEELGYLLLSGHVPLKKYARGTSLDRCFTFLRDPVQRVVSEYEHFVRNYSYNEAISVFCQDDNFSDKQSKMLKGIPVQAIGFVGVTENYKRDMSLFNYKYGTSIAILQENIGKKKLSKKYRLNEKDYEIVAYNNKNDFLLYSFCEKKADLRRRLIDSGKKYTHAAISSKNNMGIEGWAWYEGSVEDVKIRIIVNGKLLGVVIANEKTKSLSGCLVPKDGNIGFSMRAHINDNDNVVCVVENTGQKIENELIF